MILCPKLLLNRIVTIFVLTALVLLPYLSHSYFPNHYAIGARSSLHKITVGEGTIQICCSWGDQITDGILTYKIIDSSNSQVVNVVHQAIDEWNSKVSNIKLQESTSENTSADIDIKKFQSAAGYSCCRYYWWSCNIGRKKY
jgi:hypothetical protein